jgi:hypothetical protein
MDLTDKVVQSPTVESIFSSKFVFHTRRYKITMVHVFTGKDTFPM